MKYSIVIIILFWSVSGIAQDNHIMGKYKLDGFNMSAEMELKKDGSFMHQILIVDCFGGEDKKTFTGKYIINKDSVTFQPELYMIKSKLPGMKTKTDQQVYDKTKHSFREVLYILLWNNRIYLLNDKKSLWGGIQNDFRILIEEVKSERIQLLSYWNKPCACGSRKKLSSVLPTRWRKYLR